MKTAKEMVADELTAVITEMWREDNPYNDPEDYSHDFQRFCKKELTRLLKGKDE
jgi:hypothetical protein